MFFSFLTTRRKSAAIRPTARLRLELLEDRTLLNSRFVVPIASADNVTNFATLQAALATPGLNAGDIIQIEPGSVPGNIRNADLPPVTGLTVRGDPTAALSAIPQFTDTTTLRDDFTIGAAQKGFAFRHVNIGLIQTPSNQAPPFQTVGGLVFAADGTIADSTVAEISGSITVTLRGLVELDGASDVLTGTTLLNPGVQVESLLRVIAPDGSSTLVSGNVFDVSNSSSPAVIYDSFHHNPAVVTDRLIGNAFVSNGGTGIRSTAIEVADPLSGLTIQGNTISLAPVPLAGQSSQADGIAVFNNPGVGVQSLQIIGNVINLSANDATGISFFGGNVPNSLNLFIAGNQINAGPTGMGLLGGAAFSVVVQGNDFHNDEIGVEVRGNGSNTSTSVIDLGGGSLGSLGGNDFRSFTAPATASSGAIVLNAFSTSQGVVTAQKDSFAAGVDPQSVVWDGSKASGLANVDVSNNLTGNAAFVAALYADLFKRAGDTSSAADAGGLIAALNSGALTQAAVASALVHSAEALGVQVDGLYLKLLGRQSDAAGRAGFVSFLQHGGTLEQAIVLMVASPEYAALTGSDAGFVQSLYTNLLGRTGSDSEVAGLQAVLPIVGRANLVAAFLRTPEFRTDVVDQFYSATPAPTSVAALLPPLLHWPAPATPAEVNGWVFSGLSVLDVETAFVSSNEFFVDG